MSLIVELAPETEKSLREEAARQGLAESEYVRQLLERKVPRRIPAARELLEMVPEKREALLAEAAEKAAPLYEADLSHPAHLRELTAMTALDGTDPLEDGG